MIRLHPMVGILIRDGRTVYYVIGSDGDRKIETADADHANQIARSREQWIA